MSRRLRPGRHGTYLAFCGDCVSVDRIEEGVCLECDSRAEVSFWVPIEQCDEMKVAMSEAAEREAGLRKEVDQLKHAIKQEIQNNDEFGCEFVYIVMAKEKMAEQEKEIAKLRRVVGKVKEMLGEITKSSGAVCCDIRDLIESECNETEKQDSRGE